MSFISKNNPENKRVPYVVTVKFFVMANSEDNAKIQVMQNIDDSKISIDWRFETVINNQAEYNARKLELRRLEQ